MYIEAWSDITLDSMIKRLCNSYTMACPPEHVLPSRESARMSAEVYMLTQAKHDLVYPACLLGQLLLLRPARPWAKANQSLPIFPAKHDRARQPICPPDNFDPSRRRDRGQTPAEVYPITGRNIVVLIKNNRGHGPVQHGSSRISKVVHGAATIF